MRIEVVSVGPDAEDGVELVAPVVAKLELDEHGDIRKGDGLPVDFPKNATPLADGSGGFALRLDYPKTLERKQADGTVVRSDTYEVLELHRLTGKRYKIIQAAMNTEMFRPQVLAQLADMKLSEARVLEDVMDAADFAAVLRVFNFFITPGRRTGA